MVALQDLFVVLGTMPPISTPIYSIKIHNNNGNKLPQFECQFQQQPSYNIILAYDPRQGSRMRPTSDQSS